MPIHERISREMEHANAARARWGRGRVSVRSCILWGVLVASTISACAHKPPAPRDIPQSLQVPAGQKMQMMLHAIGVQIYQCTMSAPNPARYAWVLQAPAADLADPSGKNVGWHHDGPTWESYDGSKVVGEVVASAEAPPPKAVPWLLLRAKSNAGKGIFGKVKSIQRLHTVGGLPPQSACDAGHLAQRVRVAYSADYYFYSGSR